MRALGDEHETDSNQEALPYDNSTRGGAVAWDPPGVMGSEEMALLAELTEMPDFGDASLDRSQDVMQALGIGLAANLDMAPEPLQRRERRQTGNSPRVRYNPEEYDTADRSRARKATRVAPPFGSPRHNETRNHATKRNKLARDLGGGMLGARKLYLCRWCGLPKKNHSCEGAVDPELLASRQQAARSLTAPQPEAAMSSSSSTGSTAEEEGGGDEAETVLAPSPKRRAWHPPRNELGLSVDTQWQAEASAEALAGVNAVGKRIEGVFLCEGASLQWYGGLITRFSESSGEHLVVYDDGEQKWHRLFEGVAQQVLRWPDASVGADGVSPALPSSSTSTDQRKGLSLSARKRRDRPAEPEPALIERSPPAAQVCDYCNSRGKVHRRCMRLPTCHLIWKRGGKKKRDSIGDLSDLRRTAPSTPPTPAAEPVRTGREKGVAPGNQAQVMNARCNESAAMQPDADAADDAAAADDGKEVVARYDFVQSQEWPFPIIVPPEALGISFDGVAQAATVDFKQAASDEEATAAAEAAEAMAKELLMDIELPLF